MVVVMVRADPGVRPGEWGQVDKAAGLRHGRRIGRPAAHDDAGRRGGIGAAGEGAHDFLGLAHHDKIHRQLGEHGTRGRRAVRPDRDQAFDARPEGFGQHRGDVQLGLGAAPEEVGRSGGEHRHSGREARNPLGKSLHREAVERAVQHQHLVAIGLEQAAAIADLERQMRLAAAEVDAAGKAPGRVEERYPHAGTRCSAGVVLAARSRSSQRNSRARPCCQPTRACQPVAVSTAEVSLT